MDKTGCIRYDDVMVNEFRIELNEYQMELLPYTPGAFPCVCKYVDLSRYVGNSVPWHWHQRSEINFFIRGKATMMAQDKSIELKQGEAVFINSNTLHALDPEPGEMPRYFTIFFDADFLTGGYNNVYSQKYVLPVTSCRELQCFPIRSDSPDGIRMLNILVQIVDLFQEEPFGYEFTIRSALSEFWLLLYKVTADIRAGAGQINLTDEARIKEMMRYIEGHYAEKVLLEDIAASAGISERECTRCFAGTVGVSPIDYLNRHRIRVAAGQLAETDLPVSRIAEACGFSSDSYFGKMFKSVMGCSPREYRKVGR